MIKLKAHTSSHVPVGRDREIHKWIDELGLQITGGNIVVHPTTFEPRWVWYFENEEDKTLFLLKWSTC